jgi:hypothetical protein
MTGEHLSSGAGGAGPAERNDSPMEKLTTKRISLLSGRTHPALAQEVADHLGIELSDPNIVEFANTELRPRFVESIRGATCSSCRRTTRATGTASTIRSWSS